MTKRVIDSKDKKVRLEEKEEEVEQRFEEVSFCCSCSNNGCSSSFQMESLYDRDSNTERSSMEICFFSKHEVLFLEKTGDEDREA